MPDDAEDEEVHDHSAPEEPGAGVVVLQLIRLGEREALEVSQRHGSPALLLGPALGACALRDPAFGVARHMRNVPLRDAYGAVLEGWCLLEGDSV